MNILILGGTGFLGSSCAQELCKKNNVTITGFGDYSSQITNIDFRNISLQETDTLVTLMQEKKINIVMHFVSSLIPSSDCERYFADLQNVYIPTQRILEYCAKNSIKFVYISSGGAVYGNQQELFSENTKREPASYYGLSKLNFENLILFYHNMKNLDYMVIRPSNPYGHGQNLYGKQGIIAVIIGKILNEEPIEIWGDGSAVKDYIYIDDFTYYVTQLLEKDDAWNKIFNIGSGCGSSVNNVLEAFRNNNIHLPKIKYIGEKEADVKHMILNCEKIQKIVPHVCRSLEQGIKMFYEDVLRK